MIAVVLWWGYDSRLALESWQLFCGGDTTVVCYRIMAVVLWWGYGRSLVIECWQVLSHPHHKTPAMIRGPIYCRIPTKKQLPSFDRQNTVVFPKQNNCHNLIAKLLSLVWLSNAGSFFVVGIRQYFGYEKTEVA
jgi:hypothetical protein